MSTLETITEWFKNLPSDPEKLALVASISIAILFFILFLVYFCKYKILFHRTKSAWDLRQEEEEMISLQDINTKTLTPEEKIEPRDVNNNESRDVVNITHCKNKKTYSNFKNYQNYPTNFQNNENQAAMLPNTPQLNHQASLRTQISNFYKTPEMGSGGTNPVISQTPTVVCSPANQKTLNFDNQEQFQTLQSNKSSSIASNNKFKVPHNFVAAPVPAKRRSLATADIMNEHPRSMTDNESEASYNPFKAKDKITRTPMASMKSVNKMSAFKRSKQSLGSNQSLRSDHQVKINFEKPKSAKRKSDSWFLDLDESNRPNIIKDMKVSPNPGRKMRIKNESGNSPSSVGISVYEQLENRPVLKYGK